MTSPQRLVLVGCLLGSAMFAACAAPAPAPAPKPATSPVAGHAPHGEGMDHAPAPKLAAPIDLAIAQTSADGATFDLVLTATLRADVEDLALRLDKKSEVFGARKQGDVLTLTTTMRVAKGTGVDAIGGATLTLEGRVLTAAIAERVGAAAKQSEGRDVEVPGIGTVTGAKQ